MKITLFLGLLILVGCFDKSEEVTIPGAEFKRFDPLSVAPEDQIRLKAICNALESKEERLPALEGSRYTFTYAEKGCDETIYKESEAKVSIEKEANRYVFRKSAETNFAFSNVETHSHGAMAIICANIHDLRSPLQTSSKGAVWFTTFTNQRDCASDHDSMCVHLKRGEHVGDLDYQVHTDEWIKFKLRDSQLGFFVERRFVSTADCATGKSIEKKAFLK